MSSGRNLGVVLTVCLLAAFPLALRNAAHAAEPDNSAPVADKQFEGWWRDLQEDEAPATRALLKFSARPKEAVAFFKKTLKPLSIDGDAVNALLEKLGSDEEEVWTAAYEELEYFDPRLAFELEELMRDVTDPVTRQRMVEIMSGRERGSLAGKNVQLRGVGNEGFNFFDGMGSWWAEHMVSRINSFGWANTKKKWTRAVRAIILLEHLATPEAVALLKDMAGGHPDAQPTRIADEALERLKRATKP